MNTAELAKAAASEASSSSESATSRLRKSSRSPHPYHRRGVSLLESEISTSSTKSPSNGSSRPTPRSSSESGTEADDERGGVFLKGLPAPPLRVRKGVRGATPAERTPAISPLPTPPILGSNSWAFPFPQSGPVPATKLPSEQDVGRKKIKDTYTNRKRAEIVRRTVEVLLLGLIGIVSGSPPENRIKLRPWKWEIYSHILVTILLALAYPLRLTYSACRTGNAVLQSFMIGFRIPSKFDPGPLLYPVFLPLIVAISLLPRSPDFLLANSILGLSSLPGQLVSSAKTYETFSLFHWIISLVPLCVSQIAVHQLQPKIPFALKTSGISPITAEDLTLLYPLQHLTTNIIHCFTTTSLDPAELQLLSAALINVLLFSVSSQAEILKALIWLGGLGLFVSCRKVLGWEVALARIPSWRFRRSTPQKPLKRSVASGIDAALCQKLASLGSRRTSLDSSENDDDETLHPTSERGNRLPRLRLKTQNVANRHSKLSKAASAIEPPANANGKVWDVHARHGTTTSFRSQRRHTFSATGGAEPPETKTTSSGRPRRALSPNSASFLKMTLAQAQVRKWVYATFVYAVSCLIILAPIRRYVSIHALSSHEPFGWALGYLLGDVPQFRFWTVSNNLDQWIALPERSDNPLRFDHAGWISRLRQDIVGAANARLIICAYCIAVLVVGIATVLRLTSVVEVDTRRKVFHGIMVAMLLPTVFVDPCFVTLALILILAIFLLLDLFRASQLPPISKPLTFFLAPYVDGRDHRGPVIVSHIFLLIGCAIPLWLSLAGVPRTGNGPWAGWDTDVRDVSMVSGVICVGMGDAAASLIGRRYGRHKWLWSGGKSLEGSLAFAVAVTTGLLLSYTWLLIGGWVKHGRDSWVMVVAKAITAAAGASLTEAVLTSCNDNVVVPVVLWLLVRGLAI